MKRTLRTIRRVWLENVEDLKLLLSGISIFVMLYLMYIVLWLLS